MHVFAIPTKSDAAGGLVWDCTDCMNRCKHQDVLVGIICRHSSAVWHSSKRGTGRVVVKAWKTILST
jgi:Zn-finger protein